MNDYSEDMALPDFWLKTAVVISFFIAAASVLSAFLSIVTYVAFLLGAFEGSGDAELMETLLGIQKNPYTFLLFNLYNMVIWNAVILCAIWLLRYHEWARIALRSLLGFDLIVTVAHILWIAIEGTDEIQGPGWVVMMNAFQVAAIIIISHPAILERVERESTKRKTASSESEDPLS